MNLKRLALILAVFAVFCGVHASAQTATAKGTVVDADGKPVNNAVVVFKNSDNNQTYKLKTNKKGEFFQIGMLSGPYSVEVQVDNKPVFQNKTRLQLDENDLGTIKVQPTAASAPPAATPSPAAASVQASKQKQGKAVDAQSAQAEKENQKIQGLNQRLAEARAAAAAGNLDQAATIATDTANSDPTRPLLWFIAGSFD